MASGFIILADGRCLSVRHAVHDAVLRSVVAALDQSTPFACWLGSQLPAASDVDLGVAFVRAGTEEQVARVLDTRALTVENQHLFEQAVMEATPIGHAPVAPEQDVVAAIGRLRLMLRHCSEGRPTLSLSDWSVQAPPCEQRIGPGWDCSA